MLEPDVYIYVTARTGKGLFYKYLRSDNNKQRAKKTFTEPLLTKEDIENKISQLIGEGYYQLTNPILSHKIYDKMEKRGLIGQINTIYQGYY